MFDAVLRLLPAGVLAVGSGAGLSTRVGNSPRPMFVNVVINGVTGTGSLVITVSHSPDGVNYFLHTSAADQALALTASPQDAEITLPVLTVFPYLRVDVAATTITAGTLPDGARLGIGPR